MSLDVSAQAQKIFKHWSPLQNILGKICPADEDNLPAAFYEKGSGRMWKVCENGERMGEGWRETSSVGWTWPLLIYTLGSTGSLHMSDTFPVSERGENDIDILSCASLNYIMLLARNGWGHYVGSGYSGPVLCLGWSLWFLWLQDISKNHQETLKETWFITHVLRVRRIPEATQGSLGCVLV